MSNINMQIFVVSHSEEDIKKIKSDELYAPLFVGRNGKDSYGFFSDDSGDNISYKNSDLSELTGLYWMWKNTNFDIIGLCHYRRFFKNDQGKLLNKNDVIDYLNDFDIILPKKVHLIKGSFKKTYAGTYFIDVFNETRKIISKIYPDYLSFFDEVMGQDSFSTYNMFVANKSIMDEYCNWLFPIINELEECIDLEEIKRIIGVITEYLFNVWVVYQNLNVKELDLIYTGNKLKFRMFISENILCRKVYLLLSKNEKINNLINNYFFNIN